MREEDGVKWAASLAVGGFPLGLSLLGQGRYNDLVV
jgi:hypothetical protein